MRLDALDQSPAAPALQIAEPGTGVSWNGLETISWSASDHRRRRIEVRRDVQPRRCQHLAPGRVDTTSTSFSLDT